MVNHFNGRSVKSGISYEQVCPSVCLSRGHTSESPGTVQLSNKILNPKKVKNNNWGLLSKENDYLLSRAKIGPLICHISRISRKSARYEISYYYWHIQRLTRAFHWRRN